MLAFLISFEITEKEISEDINATTKWILVSYSSDDFCITAHLPSHPLIFQFPTLRNSLLFFLVYTVQMISPLQIQEIRMCKKKEEEEKSYTTTYV